VQRFITDATRKENPQFLVSSGSVESLDRTSNASERVEVKRKIAIKHHSYSMSSSNRSNTPTGKLSPLFEPLTGAGETMTMNSSLHVLCATKCDTR
jgi:hypothetical protein